MRQTDVISAYSMRTAGQPPDVTEVADSAESFDPVCHLAHSCVGVESSDQFLEQLKNGILSQQLIETWRLVDPNCSEAKVFEAECHRCVNLIAGDRLSKLNVTPRFLLSDLPYANAFIIPQAVPPIIVITRRMFTEIAKGAAEPIIATDADLMFVIDHEINHLEAAHRYKKKGNDKIEEMVGYCRPLEHLHDLGISPEHGRRLMNKLFGANPLPTNLLWYQIFADPHPLRENIESLMDNTLAALHLRRGEASTRAPVSYHGSEFSANVAKAVHISHLDRELQKQKALVSLGHYRQRISQEDSQRCILAALRAGVSPRLSNSLARCGLDLAPIIEGLRRMPTDGIEITVLQQ